VTYGLEIGDRVRTSEGRVGFVHAFPSQLSWRPVTVDFTCCNDFVQYEDLPAAMLFPYPEEKPDDNE
jgi:hypothetical protein